MRTSRTTSSTGRAEVGLEPVDVPTVEAGSEGGQPILAIGPISREQMVRYYAKLAIMRSIDGMDRELTILSRRCSIVRFL